jgi:hypothetical protein
VCAATAAQAGAKEACGMIVRRLSKATSYALYDAGDEELLGWCYRTIWPRWRAWRYIPLPHQTPYVRCETRAGFTTAWSALAWARRF